MGEIRRPPPVLRLVAAFGGSSDALAWARAEAEAAWGPIVEISERFEFAETDYYAPTMGPGLLKQFLAFGELADSSELASWKQATNAWEGRFAAIAGDGPARPLNLDPGYLDRGKLVLASTKDHAHRIHLRDGIYAETTLFFMRGAWRPREWTFPDYRREDYHRFFVRCRERYAELLRKAAAR